jgi:hypothetical protein
VYLGTFFDAILFFFLFSLFLTIVTTDFAVLNDKAITKNRHAFFMDQEIFRSGLPDGIFSVQRKFVERQVVERQVVEWQVVKFRVVERQLVS